MLVALNFLYLGNGDPGVPIFPNKIQVHATERLLNRVEFSESLLEEGIDDRANEKVSNPDYGAGDVKAWFSDYHSMGGVYECMRSL